MHRIVLPYPPKDLSPNSRLHHMAKAKAAKRYRIQCAEECMAQGAARLGCDMVEAFIEYFPPDNRKRDDDNAIASFKSGRDGVADRIGVDDREWQVTHRVHRQKSDQHPRGAVVLHIDPITVLKVEGHIS